MITYPQEFRSKSNSNNQEPIFVIELSFDLLNADTHFLTTHDVPGLAGSISNRSLKIISNSSQELNPDKANSTIGSIKFEALDVNLTDVIRSKLTENKGLKGKRVRVHKGYRGLLWEDFQPTDTYIVDNDISYKNGSYSFNCGDIQRTTRRKIFVVKETVLMTSIDADSTEIDVLNANELHLVYQLPSASGLTLLRSLQSQTHPLDHPTDPGGLVYPTLSGIDEIGIIRLDNDSDEGFELAIWTGKTGNKLTGLIRGILGTTAKSIEIDPEGGIESAPAIKEYVYLEMPAVMAVYALLTGSIYGYPGKFLPDHWHVSISTDYIKTSSFINIGVDLWDLTNPDNGFPVSIRGAEDEDAKKYIEQKIFFMLGVYAPISNFGEMGLKRLKYIGPLGSYDRLLNIVNVVSYTPLKHDLKSVLNSFVIRWNWDSRREKFTRTSVLTDPQSIERNQASDPKIIELKTLHGSRHSSNSIKYHFDSIRSRYAGPPLRIEVTLTPDQADLEVGDIVRLDLSLFEDFSNEAGKLNRNFEIQKISIDKRTGEVKLKLFGSSQRASDIAPSDTVNLDKQFITSEGTEINAANFGAAVSSAGGTTTVTGDITLAGHADLNDASCIYYCAEDLTINSGATIHIDKNVQIRVLGFLQNNGEIEGVGKGLAGGIADSVISHIKTPVAANLGLAGIGTTMAQGGWVKKISYRRDSDGNYDTNKPYISFKHTSSHGVRIVKGDSDFVTAPSLSIDSTLNLIGLPSTIMGSSGSSGGGIYKAETPSPNYSPESFLALGGPGGAGGAGLVVMASGIAYGASSRIDLSGAPGLPGADTAIFFDNYSYNPATDVIRAGAGAGGASGGLLVVTLNSNQTFPNFSASNTVLNHGVCPEANTSYDDIRTRVIGGETRLYRHGSGDGWGLPASSPGGGGGSVKVIENTWSQNAKILFLDINSIPVADLPDYVESTPTFTLTEYTNTPVTPDGNRSTIEVSVTPPNDTNYSYSLVDYREVGTTTWISAKPASHESIIEVNSDGKQYEVRIRPVSLAGIATTSGPIQQGATTDINGRTNAELSVVYPFATISGIKLQGETGSVFSGPHASFEWDHNNSERAYFNHYEVEIYSAGLLLRTEISVSPFFVYSYAKNVMDYLSNTAADGVYLSIEIKVRAVSKHYNNVGGLYSGAQSSFLVSASVIDSYDNLRFIKSTHEDMVQAIADAAAAAGGSFKIWYDSSQPTDPSLDTGDYWFDIDDFNKLYIYDGLIWSPAPDTGIASVINSAQNAQTTADGVAVTYVQTTAPTLTADDVGDLWVNSQTRTVKRWDGAVFRNYATHGAEWGGSIYDQPEDERLLNSLIDTTGWNEGSAIAVDGFDFIGLGAENALVKTDGPSSDTEIIWRCTNKDLNASSQDFPDGGFISNVAAIDPKRTARFSCWVRRLDAQSGIAILGVKPGIDGAWINNMAGGNLFSGGWFIDGGAPNTPNIPVEDKWYLMVGFLHPESTSLTVSSGLGGIYDPETGDNIHVAEDYKFSIAATKIRLEAAYYFSTSINTRMELSRPRIDVIDGREPSLSELFMITRNLDRTANDKQEWDQIQNNPFFIASVTAGGTLTSTSQNLSAVLLSTGKYRITHGFGNSTAANTFVTGSNMLDASNIPHQASVLSYTANYFDIWVQSTGTGTLKSLAFNFTIARA